MPEISYCAGVVSQFSTSWSNRRYYILSMGLSTCRLQILPRNPILLVAGSWPDYFLKNHGNFQKTCSSTFTNFRVAYISRIPQIQHLAVLLRHVVRPLISTKTAKCKSLLSWFQHSVVYNHAYYTN